MSDLQPTSDAAPASDANAFYQQLYECSPNAVIVFALDSRKVLAANPSLLAFVADGGPTPSPIGQPIDQLFGPELATALHNALETLISAHAATLVPELCFLHWGNRTLLLRLGWPPAGLLGQSACVLTLHDVTEQERIRHELEGHQSQLESLVEERTAALRTAMHAAEAANRAKTLFLSNMSHELRTPLNAILGYSRLLEREPAMTDEHRQKLGAIHRAGEHLLSLINDVLEITRSDPQTALQPPQTFALNDLLRTLEKKTRRQTDAKQLQLAWTVDARLPAMVQGHPDGLQRILAGLLDNAIKYTERGQIGLHVTPENDVVHFAVSDAGSGIPAAEREQIFRPFAQTAAGAARGEGTGLGLYLAREYARRMGGDLRQEEGSAHGCLFVLTLPLPAAIQVASAGTVCGLAGDAPPPRLLVVDDQADNRWLASHLLESIGFEIATAENGEEAIAAVQSNPPDLICMDMRMPVLDGYEATRRIRALPGGDRIRIVAMSASTQPEERASMFAAGCDRIVGKPLNDAELLDTLQALLGLRYRYAETESPAAVEAAHADECTPTPPVPLRYRAALAQAAEILDLDACRHIAKEMAEEDAVAASHLEMLLRQFRFEQVRIWCQGPPSPL